MLYKPDGSAHPTDSIVGALFYAFYGPYAFFTKSLVAWKRFKHFSLPPFRYNQSQGG
jgi:hypothetical protein